MLDDAKPLRNDLIKIIVEKLLIGAIVVLLGVVAGNVADKVKSQRTFSAELNRTRVEKISEVWEKIGIYEGDFENRRRMLSDEVDKVLDKNGIPTKKPSPNPPKSAQLDNGLQLAFSELNRALAPKKSYEEVVITINKNRLLLGEANYEQIRKYLDLSNQLLYFDPNSTVEQRNQLAKDRDLARANLIQIRDKLFTE